MDNRQAISRIMGPALVMRAPTEAEIKENYHIADCVFLMDKATKTIVAQINRDSLFDSNGNYFYNDL